MSRAGFILGISELEVERVFRDREVLVYARPSRRPRCIHCDHERVRIKATRVRRVKHTRQGNQVLTLVLKSPKYHSGSCGRYFCHRFKGVRPRFRASEAFRIEVFEAHDGGITQRKIALTHDISAATVERWYQSQ